MPYVRSRSNNSASLAKMGIGDPCDSKFSDLCVRMHILSLQHIMEKIITDEIKKTASEIQNKFILLPIFFYSCLLNYTDATCISMLTVPLVEARKFTSQMNGDTSQK